MPSNKPRLATYTTQEVIDKFNYISSHEHRSTSKELEHIVTEYINKFELQNGVINIDENGNTSHTPHGKGHGKLSISKTG